MSIDREQFDVINQKHGGYASWAVWAAPETLRPKSNIGDLSIFDLAANPATLAALNPGVVMVGLNISGPLIAEPFRNFHSPKPYAHDFKIRYTFSGSPFYGAYMTDIIKTVEAVSSTALRGRLRSEPSLIGPNIAKFRVELHDLRSQRPTILAFGSDAYDLLAKNLLEDEFSVLIQVTHYSHWKGKEEYREEVMAQISRAQV